MKPFMLEISQAKDSRIDLRVTQEQKELLEKAASLRGVSLSAYSVLRNYVTQYPQ